MNNIINNRGDFDVFSKKIIKCDAFAFDTETNDLSFDRSMVGCSFAFYHDGKLEGYYIPVRHEAGEDLFAIAPKNFDLTTVIELLFKLFTDDTKTVYIHNAKFDIKVLRNEGIDPSKMKAKIIDTLAMSWLIDPSRKGGHSLKKLVSDLLDYNMTTFDSLSKGYKRNSYIPVGMMGKYAIDDAVYLFKLYEELYPMMNDSQKKVLCELEMPVLFIVEEIEHYGFKFDVEKISQANKNIRSRIDQIESDLRELLGDDLNISSPQWLSKKMCGEYWGVKGVKKGANGNYSTANEYMEKWANGEIPGTTKMGQMYARLIIKHRKLSKMLSTYTNKLPKFADSNNRIHGSFNQFGTDTGRMSSSNPNLQSIPSSRSEEGDLLRKSFIAEEGYDLIVADYSQIELRVMAHLSADPVMTSIYEQNGDIHQMTADACGSTRHMAKSINFGLIYKMGAKTLSSKIDTSVSQAQKYSDKYFSNYVGVATYQQKLIHQAREKGYTWTITGRRRYLPDLNLGDNFKKSSAERRAINTQVQGSAADIIKIGMRNFIRRIRKEGYTSDDVRIVCQVHDELIVESKKDISAYISEALKHEMENCVKLRVPLIAEPEIGATWGDAK